MRSTEGIYYSRLDHVRALAAYLVFAWHFLHMTPHFPVPYASAPPFPFALLDEGHTGVALFMTLSGYLFAKLVSDHRVDFPCFLWSRAVRLAPLLIVVIAAWIVIEWLAGAPLPWTDIAGGVLFPTWPRGTWSITIKMHFYLLFPLLLFLFRRQGPFALLMVVAGALLLLRLVAQFRRGAAYRLLDHFRPYRPVHLRHAVRAGAGPARPAGRHRRRRRSPLS